MLDRILGVFKLDVPTFEAIEHDTSATPQAAIIVLIVALLAGIGNGFLATMGEGGVFVTGFISSLIWTFIGWILWSLVSWFVGTNLFGGKASVDEMLRVIGFAYAPQMLSIIPCIGGLIGWIWSLIAGFIAVRQGLDLDNTKAFLTVLVGFIVYVIGNIVVGAIIGGTGALLGF
jgi:hypothetical protein